MSRVVEGVTGDAIRGQRMGVSCSLVHSHAPYNRQSCRLQSLVICCTHYHSLPKRRGIIIYIVSSPSLWSLNHSVCIRKRRDTVSPRLWAQVEQKGIKKSEKTRGFLSRGNESHCLAGIRAPNSITGFAAWDPRARSASVTKDEVKSMARERTGCRRTERLH